MMWSHIFSFIGWWALTGTLMLVPISGLLRVGSGYERREEGLLQNHAQPVSRVMPLQNG